jgi:hypothetical protein
MARDCATRLALACALVCSIGCGQRAPSVAEPSAAAEVDLLTLVPKPGRAAELEEFLRALAGAARASASDVRWTVHASVERDPATYVVVVRNASSAREAWARFAPADVLERALGAEEARRLLELRENSLESLTRTRYVERRDLANSD